MFNRITLIRYRSRSGWRVGSGLIVRDGVVLTADHVADGDEYWVECADRKFRAEPLARTDDPDVDLALLRLLGPESGITPLSCARVDRSRAARIDGCYTVGFPRWNENKSKKVRETAQVSGFVRTSDGLHMLAAGGTAGQFLTLIGDRVPGEPDLPDGEIDYGPSSPWAGMSGAAVIARDMVIGVVRSHHLSKGLQALTVTPLTALQLLSAKTRQKFCAALGIADLDELTLLAGDATAVPLSALQLTSAAALGDGAGLGDGDGFSAQVRERYADDLAMASLGLPERWDLATLEQLHQDCQRKTSAQDATGDLRRAADLLEALCMAARALPALRAVGGPVISTRKLRHLYLRHVGNRPDADTLEEMLILAALVWISERRGKGPDPGDQPAVPNALARFLLGIAGYWKGPGLVALDDAELAELAKLVTGSGAHQYGQQWEDAADYLATKVRRRTWALIEFDAPDPPDAAVPTWPKAISVHAIPERGSAEYQCFPCATASRAGVEEALREAVDWLPEGDVYVDLCLPRNWLEVGVEHWDVVEMGGWYESLAKNFQPRLRWSMHWRHPRLRDRLRERLSHVDWMAAPEDIHDDVAEDPASFGDWLSAREAPGTKHPPYLTGGTARARDHDPLGMLLREGYGFVAWFDGQAPDGARRDAVRTATSLNNKQKRREELPELLAAKLKAHRPAIIWSDPDGRAEFLLPSPRQASARGRFTQ